ncbi:ImmA/IrrE family metallo-endopeptidase [Bradyrhizobium algeriense]|uniref:ImmA/IrrE family metallo-endopeptidase n=1 Tax=Bradyrhizobium algeriense TaxID=634784 RepID=UPI001FCF17F8|nr:ImmA/IrrE family metallo-endopeptidase [Bradyrhizobium algeriense]
MRWKSSSLSWLNNSDDIVQNILLSRPTVEDIDAQVAKVLRGLGNPEPPLQLQDVRELLRIDRAYYSSRSDGFLRETVSKLTVAGVQILQRPTLLLDAVRKFDLRALYLPDRKRILLDQSQPDAKQRWNEAHEIGHSLLPWHADLMLGDHEQSLTPGCHAQVEAEANYTAGQLLFLQARFVQAANDTLPSLDAVRSLKSDFGNTYTTTFWRYIEGAHTQLPMIGMIGPHPRRPPANFDAMRPFRYLIESPAFADKFRSIIPAEIHRAISSYCGHQRAGPLGSGEALLTDKNDDQHVFLFETFCNTYDCLSLAVYQRPHLRIVGF